jgi:leucine dehydrogenase
MVPWQSTEFDDHEQVCAFFDRPSGLRAIVAIHSTALGPAIGGTRFWPYLGDEQALDDVLRLSRAMSYKSALAGLPCGGGKAVIVGDPAQLKSRSLLQTYGRFLNRVGSQFTTAEDVGFSVDDCEIVREVSPFVAGTATSGAGDPSIHTARGVLHGLRAVLEIHFNRPDFRGTHFAVQGLGNVGWRVCEYLHQAGARLSVADIREDKAKRASTQFAASIVPSRDIHAIEADVFVPCALGAVVNRDTVGAIRARAVAGAANNQLASAEFGEALQQRDILYAPDFVINAGGIIGATEEVAAVQGRNLNVSEPLETRLERIYDRLIDIFAQSSAESKTPEETAIRMARDLIGR